MNEGQKDDKEMPGIWNKIQSIYATNDWRMVEVRKEEVSYGMDGVMEVICYFRNAPHQQILTFCHQ